MTTLFVWWAVITASLVASCAAVPISPISPVDKPWTNYAIGTVRTAATGETLIEGIDGTRWLPGFKLVGPLKVERLRSPTNYGELWAASYRYEGPCGYYLITNPRFYPNEIGVIVSEDGAVLCEESVL